jgi:DNA-binding HxlR family transcriptional regulator
MGAVYPSIVTERSTSTPSDVTLSNDELTRLLCQPVRQALLRALLAREAMSFSELKRVLNLTDGNLCTHARKLEDAGVLSYTKGFRGRLPRTEYRLTAVGRAAAEKMLGAPAPKGL